MALENLTKLRTRIIAIGDSMITTPGCREVDILYYGTVDAVTFIGSYQPAAANDPLPIPPNIPYHLPFNQNGYNSITITNGGDAPVYVSEYF